MPPLFDALRLGDDKSKPPNVSIECTRLRIEYRRLVQEALADGRTPIDFPTFLRSKGLDENACQPK